MGTQSAPAVSKAQVAEYTTMLLERLGLPEGASNGEIEKAHDERVDFLSQAPPALADWAASEIALVDQAYALLSDPHADIPAAAAAALPPTVPEAADPTPEQAPPRGVNPDRASGQPRARLAGSTRLLIVVGVVAAVVFGVYKMGGSSDVPDISGQPTDTQQAAAVQVDQAKVATAMQKLAKDPKDVATLKELGDLYFQGGDYATAADWETKALAAAPNDTTALLALGAAQFNSGDSGAAQANWEKVVKLDPANAEAHYDLGFLALSAQPADMTEAKAHWQKVVDIDPNSELAKSVATHLKGLADQQADPKAAGN